MLGNGFNFDGRGETLDAAAPGTAQVAGSGDQAVVALEGEHDMATIDVVDRAFAEAEAARPRRVVVDLSRCVFMDSTVVRALLLARERAESAGSRMVLVVGNARDDSVVQTVLRVSGVGAVFEVYTSLSEALGRATRGLAAAGDDDSPHVARHASPSAEHG